MNTNKRKGEEEKFTWMDRIYRIRIERRKKRGIHRLRGLEQII